ncbi:MAG: hypothetical protein ACN4GZ_14135 [Acidimicrobiales bacterium]
MNSTLLLAYASDFWGWIGVVLIAALIYGLVKRLFKIAIFFGIAAFVAWAIFFTG